MTDTDRLAALLRKHAPGVLGWDDFAARLIASGDIVIPPATSAEPCDLCGNSWEDSDHGLGGTHNWRPAQPAALVEAKRLLQGQFSYAINPEYYYPGDITSEYDDIIDRALALAQTAAPAEPSCCELACYEDPGCACDGCQPAAPDEGLPYREIGYTAEECERDMRLITHGERGCTNPDEHLLTRNVHMREGLLHEMRAYARHAPLCNYSPTYPDAQAATCDCGFDAVLARYDPRSAGHAAELDGECENSDSGEHLCAYCDHYVRAYPT